MKTREEGGRKAEKERENDDVQIDVFTRTDFNPTNFLFTSV